MLNFFKRMVVIKHSKLVEWFFMTGASISLGRFILEFLSQILLLFFRYRISWISMKNLVVLFAQTKKNF